MFWGAFFVYFVVENSRLSRVRMLTEAGDDEFEEFVRARAGGLYGTALLLTGDRQVAEDLLQTALTQAWRSWDEITTSHEGYVRRILVNTYMSWRRRKWHGERPTDEVPEEHAGDNDAAMSVDLLGAVRRLARRQRAVIVLRYYEDLPDAEIASLLGCSVSTVRSQAHRALARLRIDTAFEESN